MADERILIEGVRPLLTQADDLGESYVKTEDPVIGARFSDLARRLDSAFVRLTGVDHTDASAAAVHAHLLWDVAEQEIQKAISYPVGSAEDRLNKFHDVIDESSMVVADLYAIELSEVEEEITSAHTREMQQLVAFLVTLLVSSLVALWLSRKLGRSIKKPLLSLEQAAERVGADDLSHRISVQGDDELARVSDAFNAMAARVEESRDALSYQALHDPLTGLSNRTLFMEWMKRGIARADRRGTPLSVLYLDLDGFKEINDSKGHEAGDKMLVTVATCLQESIRQEDAIARLGGDEFGILLEENPAGAVHAAERVLACLDGIGDHQPGQAEVAASIGIATREHKEELDELLRQADEAMYAAKAAGKGGWEVFGAGPESALRQSQTLRAELGRAIENEEFVVHYQPIVKLKSGAIDSVEALVRWNHPTRGLLLPIDFLDEAEEAGQIVAIDRWVLREACRQVCAWRRDVPAAENLSLNVNLSAKQLQHPGLASDVAEALEFSGLAAEHLILEITETFLLRDTDTAENELRQLKALDVQIALDDFGTGFSSVSRLMRFPIDIIKIDRSFVSALGELEERSDLVLALVNLGETLGLEVVAEGIETASQLDYLRSIECEQGQGYFFAKPLGAPLMESVLQVGCSVRDIPPALDDRIDRAIDTELEPV
jgi:diguanylate cyclase (GGDEF)-like protein